MRLIALLIQFITYVFSLAQLSQSYSYAGLYYENSGPLTLGVAVLGMLLLALLLPGRLVRPSDGVLWVMASFLTVPTLAFLFANGSYDLWTRVVSCVAVLGGTILTILLVGSPSLQPLRVPRATPDATTYRWLVLVAVLGVLAISVIAYGFSGFDLGFDDIYARRLAAREVVSPFPGADYLVMWQGAVLVPLLLTLGIAQRSMVPIAVAVLAVLVQFSIAGEKGAIFGLVFTVVVYLAFRAKRSMGAPPLAWALAALLVVPVVIDSLLGSLGFQYALTRRLGLIPAMLTNEYVEYADANGSSYFQQHILKFVSEGEPLAPARVIGELISPGAGTNANANALADGYLSWGLLGAFLMAALLGLFLRLLDRAAIGKDLAIAGAAIVSTMAAVTNAYLPTTVVSGGGLLLLLMIWLLPPGSRQPEANEDHRDQRMSTHLTSEQLESGDGAVRCR